MRQLLEDLLEEAGRFVPSAGRGGRRAGALGDRGPRANLRSPLPDRPQPRRSFPRGIREDPLLPDDLRRILQRVMPDVPIKARGDSMRSATSSPSFSRPPPPSPSPGRPRDDDGKPLPASPLVERPARAAGRREGGRRSGASPGPDPWAGTAPPPPRHAVMAGLHAPRRWWGKGDEDGAPGVAGRARRAGLTISPPSGWPPAASPCWRRWTPTSALRTAVRCASGSAPYFGLHPAKLPGGTEGEPRLRDLYVTPAGKISRPAPGSSSSSALLRIEPTPDPLNAPSRRHPRSCSATSSMARSTRSPVLPGARGSAGWPCASSIRWPSSGRRVARSSRLPLRGVQPAARGGGGSSSPAWRVPSPSWPSRCWRPVRTLDWAGGAVSVLATEYEGRRLDVGDAGGLPPARVLFKADRVDKDSGGLGDLDRLQDRPADQRGAPAGKCAAATFLARVRKGSHLQAVGLLAGLGGPIEGALPLPAPGNRRRRRREAGGGPPADREFTEAFVEASEAVLGAWETGSFFPRLVELDGRKEPGRCGLLRGGRGLPCATTPAPASDCSNGRKRIWRG